MSQLENVLSPLKLDTLDNEWVENVWNGEFMDYIEFPSEYGELLNDSDVLTALKTILQCFRTYIVNVVPDDASVASPFLESWRELTPVVRHKTLIALLFCLINDGEKNPTSKSSRERALIAAKIYIVMVTVPGRNAFGIFHPQMFIGLFRVCKFAGALLGTEKSYNDSILCREINSVNRHILEMLKDLLSFINVFNLKSEVVCLEETVSSLVDLTDIALMEDRSYIDKNVLRDITNVSYECLDKLVLNFSTEADKHTLNTICKCLMHKLISYERSKRKIMVHSRTNAVSFSNSMISKYGNCAIDEVCCLIEHLSCELSGMERAANRACRVTTIIDLMCILPKQVYANQLQWIMRLAKTSVPTRRSVALDVIGLLLTGDNAPVLLENENDDSHLLDDSDVEDNLTGSCVSNVLQHHGDVGHRDLLKIIVERCDDVACAVRNSALAILVTCTAPQNERIHFLVKDLFGGGDILMDIIDRKFQDERVAVRKIAVKLLDNLLQTREEMMSKKNLKLIVERCRDASIQVRTSAITTLTNLAIKWNNAVVAESWLDGVLNQLSDPEAKIQEIVLNALSNLLFSNIIEYNSGSGTGKERFPWILLNALARKNMRRHLGHACRMLSNESRIINASLLNILKSHIRTENNFSCWILLSCVARFIPVKDVSFVLEYFDEKYSESILEDIPLLVLVQEVLCEWCAFLDEDQKENLKEKLIKNLSTNVVLPGASRGTVSLLIRLSQDNSWAGPLLESYEVAFVNNQNFYMLDGNQIIAMADVALAADKKPSKNITNLLMQLVMSFTEEDNCNYLVGTRAAAIAALGKFSLRDGNVARKTTELCSKILVSAECPLPLKINAMCVLTDMSRRYASVVEPVMPKMYICLANENVTIRRMAVQLLTYLLVSGYIKFRRTLYFNYFTLVCDEDDRIKDTAMFYLFQSLIKNEKNILYNNFVQSILYYNNYINPIVNKDFDILEEERRLFSMQGEEKQSQRHNIYDLMLSHMAQIQRLNIQQRLCNQAIIIGESDGNGTDILKDILHILRKLPKFSDKENSDDPTAKLTNSIVSQKMKMNLIEKIVPMVLRLYRHLKINKSPLMTDIVGYACDLLKDCKKEVEEVLEKDEDLLQEIKKFQSTCNGVDDMGEILPSVITPNPTPAKSPRKGNNTLTPKRKMLKAKRKLL